MADLLIRGLSDGTLARLDEQASQLGLSRNELLKRRLEQQVPDGSQVAVTAEDWRRFGEAFPDLGDPEIMKGAWD